MKSEQTRKDESRKQARFSVTGNDRQTENADLSNTGLSGSTTGDSEINYGMGEEGVPATGNVLGDEESALTHGGGDSRQQRRGMKHPEPGQRSGGSTQESKQHTEKKGGPGGSGSR